MNASAQELNNADKTISLAMLIVQLSNDKYTATGEGHLLMLITRQRVGHTVTQYINYTIVRYACMHWKTKQRVPKSYC